MRFSNYILALVFPFALAACAGGETGTAASSGGTPSSGTAASGADAEDKGAVLATVGDVHVYENEFQSAAARKTPANGESLTIEEKKEVLQKLVEEKALYQEAKKKGVDQDPKVQKVMINTLLRQEVYAGVRNSDFTQEELRAYFDAHRDEFVVPEKVQVKRIFIKVSEDRTEAAAKALAEDLRGKVAKDPSKFADVASENSEDPYRRRGGDLGFVGKDGKPGIDQAVVDKAFTMKVGEVSEAFSAGGGYNIVMVANKRDRVERTFEQMRGSVLRKVKNERYRELYDKYVGEVGKTYPASIDEAALAKVEVEAARRVPGPGVGGPIGVRAPGEEMEGEMDGPEGLPGMPEGEDGVGGKEH